jgi:hypothetical protein
MKDTVYPIIAKEQVKFGWPWVYDKDWTEILGEVNKVDKDETKEIPPVDEAVSDKDIVVYSAVIEAVNDDGSDGPIITLPPLPNPDGSLSIAVPDSVRVSASERKFGPFKEKMLVCTEEAKAAIQAYCAANNYEDKWDELNMNVVPIEVLVQIINTLDERELRKSKLIPGAYQISSGSIGAIQKTHMNVILGRRSKDSKFHIDKFSLYHSGPGGNNGSLLANFSFHADVFKEGQGGKKAALDRIINDVDFTDKGGRTIEMGDTDKYGYIHVEAGQVREKIDEVVSWIVETYKDSLEDSFEINDSTMLQDEWDFLKRVDELVQDGNPISDVIKPDTPGELIAKEEEIQDKSQDHLINLNWFRDSVSEIMGTCDGGYQDTVIELFIIFRKFKGWANIQDLQYYEFMRKMIVDEYIHDEKEIGKLESEKMAIQLHLDDVEKAVAAGPSKDTSDIPDPEALKALRARIIEMDAQIKILKDKDWREHEHPLLAVIMDKANTLPKTPPETPTKFVTDLTILSELEKDVEFDKKGGIDPIEQADEYEKVKNPGLDVFGEYAAGKYGEMRDTVDLDAGTKGKKWFAEPVPHGGSEFEWDIGMEQARRAHLDAEFYAQGGRIVEAPDQGDVKDWVESVNPPKGWSIGLKATDFLIPVCHQGMNRSQVMRMALCSFAKRIHGISDESDLEDQTKTKWVARAHGAVSGCDAHSAYGEAGPVTEYNFGKFLFDTGEIFEPDYKDKIQIDDNPQEGPLQRGFTETFGVMKEPRIGEEMARKRQLNPKSEHTTAIEFKAIGENRAYTNKWFNKWLYGPIDNIHKQASQTLASEAPGVDELTIPPPSTKRRIFFAFARAVPGVIARLIEAGGCENSVVVSLQYDDDMNHELRHCAGKTPDELRQTMIEVHTLAYKMYAYLLHVHK